MILNTTPLKRWIKKPTGIKSLFGCFTIYGGNLAQDHDHAKDLHLTHGSSTVNLTLAGPVVSDDKMFENATDDGMMTLNPYPHVLIWLIT